MNQNAPDGLLSVRQSSSQFWRELIKLAFVAIIYWLSVRLGFLFVSRPEGIASIWPVSGFALAVLLITNKHQWGKLLTVIFITNIISNWSGGNSLFVSFGFALANTIEPALGAWALTHFCRSNITFERIIEVVALLFVATLVNGVSALLGATVSTIAYHGSFLNNWVLWWAADGLGIILVTPTIVNWAKAKSVMPSASLRQILETVIFTLILTTFIWLLFGPFTTAEHPQLRSYMLFPLLIWLAFRFNLRGTAHTILLITVIAIWNTLQGYGIFSFSNQTQTEHLVNLQLFLAVTAFSSLIMSALVTEYKHAEVKLHNMKERLESANIELQTALEGEKRLAHTDALTGINNRRYLFELAEHEFDTAKRYQNPLSVIMFDIDHFKQINDTFGHALGDQVLQLITQAVCSELRSADVIGRYGGDEFVILLPQTSAQETLLLTERIHESIAAIQIKTQKGPLSLTISIGIAQTYHAVQPDSVEDLFLRADQAMYIAKRSGRNCAVVFDQDGAGAT